MKTAIEKLRTEVERLKDELIEEAKKGYKSKLDEGRISAFEDILLYIDSLPKDLLIHGNTDSYKWGYQRAVDEACEWLEKESDVYIGFYDKQGLIDNFKKAMEDEQ